MIAWLNNAMETDDAFQAVCELHCEGELSDRFG